MPVEQGCALAVVSGCGRYARGRRADVATADRDRRACGVAPGAAAPSRVRIDAGSDPATGPEYTTHRHRDRVVHGQARLSPHSAGEPLGHSEGHIPISGTHDTVPRPPNFPD